MTAVTPIGPRTAADIDTKEAQINALLDEMAQEIEKMRASGAPEPIRARHERAAGRLHIAKVGLRDPEAANRMEGAAREALPDDEDGRAMLQKCEAIRKAEPDVSSAEAFRQSLRDPAISAAYYAQSGTKPPTRAPARGVLEKAERNQLASVEQLAAHLERAERLRPTAAYAKALRDCGIGAEAGAAA